MAYRATEVLHNMKFVDIKHRHLQGVVDASTMQPSSVGKIKTLYNQLYKEAIKMEVVKESLAHLVEVPTIEASDKDPFSEKEIATLWKGNHRFHLMLIYTGTRISELLGVKREDVHLDNRYLVGGNKTQAGKKRLIPICKKVMPLFEAQMSETDGRKWLFPAVEKTSVSLSYTHANNKIWKPVVEKYGMKHTAHDCRMTFISRLDTLGAPMTVTQRIVGHSTGSVIDKHYIRKSMDELLSWVDKLE